MSSTELFLGAIHLVVGILILLLGLVIFREAPRQRLHQTASILLFSAGLGALLGSSSFLLILVQSAGTPFQVDFVRNFAYLWEFFFPALLLMAALFPEELPLLRRHPSLEFHLFVPHAFHFVVVLLTSILGPDLGMDRIVSASGFLRPVASVLNVFLSLLLKSHQTLFSLVNLTYVAVSMALILRSLRRTSHPMIRRQLQTIFFGLGTCVVLYSAAYPIPDLLGLIWPPRVSSSILVAALSVGTASIAYAVVRFKFLDLHRLVRRSILYATVTAVLVGIYLAVVRYLGRAALRMAGVESEILDPVFLVLALLLFQPLLERVESLLESMLVGTPTDHRQILATASQSLARTTEPRALVDGLIPLLMDGLGLQGAAFLAAGDGGLRVFGSHGLGPEALEVLARELPCAAAGWPDGRPLARNALGPWLPERGIHTPELVVPVLSGDELLGALVLGRKVTRTGFRREDMILLRTLAGYLALTLKNRELLQASVEKALLEEQLSLARKIQQSILPGRFPRWEGLDIWAHQVPSLHVGGDYYDVLQLAPDRYALAIADVAGKGVPAALLMSMVAAGVRTLAQADLGVGPTMAKLNRLLCRATAPEQFVTFFLAVVDTGARTICYANAGHSFPILLTANRSPRFLTESDIVLGILPDADYRESKTEFEEGGALLLYTDGVTEAEAPDGEMFGESRLLARLAEMLDVADARLTVEGLQRTILGFSGNGPLSDDLTLLYARFGGGAGGPHPVESHGNREQRPSPVDAVR